MRAIAREATRFSVATPLRVIHYSAKSRSRKKIAIRDSGRVAEISRLNSENIAMQFTEMISSFMIDFNTISMNNRKIWTNLIIIFHFEGFMMKVIIRIVDALHLKIGLYLFYISNSRYHSRSDRARFLLDRDRGATGCKRTKIFGSRSRNR